MKYSLRSLMIAVLVLPPLLAILWWVLQKGLRDFTAGNDKPLHAAAVIGFLIFVVLGLFAVRPRKPA